MTTTAMIIGEATWTMLCIVRSGRPIVLEYLESLAAPDTRKVTAFLQRTVQSGPLGYSDEKSKKLTDQIFELKPTREVRLLYFFDWTRRMVITHGFTKKRGKTPRTEIDRALELRGAYIEERGS
jgi:phage-related protein